MSWAEVKRINSDFMNEPLNFHNYISDISTFGAESYVFDHQNEWVFRELMSYSLLVYGHKGIHKAIYERLTDLDVDYILLKHNRLGQAWNSFYRCELFETGSINSILKGMTIEAYSTLERKFQQGIHRYVESHLGKSQGVGTWVDTLFELNNIQLQMKETLQEIVEDESLMLELIQNDSIALILCCSMSLMSLDMSNEVFQRLLSTIATSTQATLDLIETMDSEEKLQELFENQEALNILVQNQTSMEAIVQNSKAFQVLLDSSIRMQMVSNSSVARDVIVTALKDALSANEVYERAKSATNVLEDTHKTLIDGSTVTDIINDTQVQISKAIETMLNLLCKTDVIFTNVSEMLEHTEAMKQMMESRELMKLIFAHEITKTAFIKAIESNTILKQMFSESLTTSGFYTKSKLTSKTWTPVYVAATDEYVVDNVVTAKENAIIQMTRLFVYDKEPSDNGATGPYKLYVDGILKKSGTIKGYKTVETDITLDFLCHSFNYNSKVSGLIPLDCMQKKEYYTYTIS